MDSNYSKAGYYNWRVMLIDDVRSLRRTAGQQRQVCLPLDTPGWDRIYREAADELERRGITAWPVARVRGA